MKIGKEIAEKAIVYKTSRRAYFYNYVLVGLILVLFILVYTKTPYMSQFTLLPRTTSQLTSTLIVFGFLIFISFLIEEPVIERFIRQYHITNNEVMKVEGIISKKKIIIPYQSVSGLKVNQSITGRIFNFGNVDVHGFGETALTMKGMGDPNEVYRIIENKISQFKTPSKWAKKK